MNNRPGATPWCVECGKHQVAASWQLCPVCLDVQTRAVIAAIKPEK